MSTSESKSAQPSADDRRRVRRVRLITQVESVASGFSTLGRSQDISEGGVMVVTEETLDAETEVAVRFNLPPYPPGLNIEAPGVVAWVRVAESMGIRFLQLTDQQRKAIAKYIRLDGKITQHGLL